MIFAKKIYLLLIVLALVLMEISALAQQEKLVPDVRESHLQEALKLRGNEDYLGAIQKLNIILEVYPQDAPILLLKGDVQLQSNQFGDAANTFRELLPLNYETTMAKINLSYALFMNREETQALSYAKSAWENDSDNTNAIVNYFNALLWNGKTKDASQFLLANNSTLVGDKLMVMKARLFTTSGHYRQGLLHYDSLVKAYPDKYYVREYAEVLLSKKEIGKASDLIMGSKDLYSRNEYEAITGKIENAQMQHMVSEFVYFKDVADNVRFENNVGWSQKEGAKYKLGVKAGLSTITSAELEKTQSKSVAIAVSEKWSMAWRGQTDIGIQKITFNGQSKYTAITGRQLIQYQPTDRFMVGALYSSNILNFTASLLEKNIRSNRVGYMTHIMVNGKNGIYSEGDLGSLTDKNRKLQFFGSLYHLFSTSPLLKGGVNVSLVHFRNKSANYFSPEKYLSTEIFLDFNTQVPGIDGLQIATQAAAGLQQIETLGWDPAVRLQAELSYTWKRFQSSLKYQTSNVAAGTGAGHKFNWYTFNLIWRW